MNNEISFMDFCSGIGAGRLGLEKCGFKCVAHSEIESSAIEVYKSFFVDDINNFGDLTKIDIDTLPNFDLMIAGFPCQTFSVVGKRTGFEDSRGLIIYSLIEILKKKSVKYFIFENVKGLVNHDKGNTLNTILNELSYAGYDVTYKVLNTIDYGIPQMRERIYFVGVQKELSKSKFEWFQGKPLSRISDFLIDETNNTLDYRSNKTFIKYLNNKYNKGKFDINKIILEDYTVLDTRQSDLRLYYDKVPTLRTGRHGILYVKNGSLKKLSGMEALMLQGFPKQWAVNVQKQFATNKLLSLAGNAMTVDVINLIGKNLLNVIGD